MGKKKKVRQGKEDSDKNESHATELPLSPVLEQDCSFLAQEVLQLVRVFRNICDLGENKAAYVYNLLRRIKFLSGNLHRRLEEPFFGTNAAKILAKRDCIYRKFNRDGPSFIQIWQQTAAQFIASLERDFPGVLGSDEVVDLSWQQTVNELSLQIINDGWQKIGDSLNKQFPRIKASKRSHKDLEAAMGDLAPEFREISREEFLVIALPDIEVWHNGVCIHRIAGLVDVAPPITLDRMNASIVAAVATHSVYPLQKHVPLLLKEHGFPNGRGTVNLCLAELVRDGFLERIEGGGYRVALMYSKVKWVDVLKQLVSKLA